MSKITYFFGLWIERAKGSKRDLRMYFDVYTPFDDFDQIALDAAIALAED